MLVGYVDENRDVKWREVPANNDKMSKDCDKRRKWERRKWEKSSNELIKIQRLNKEKAIVANERINQIQTEIDEFKVKVEVEETDSKNELPPKNNVKTNEIIASGCNTIPKHIPYFTVPPWYTFRVNDTKIANVTDNVSDELIIKEETEEILP